MLGHGFLDAETTTINVVLPKAVRNFIKINLDKSETINEKNYNEWTSTRRQGIEDSTLHEEIDTTITVDLVTTTETSKLPQNSTTTRHPTSTDKINSKYPEVETSNRSVLWFFGGAIAGVILSFVVFSVYSFFKSRTSSIYQNL